MMLLERSLETLSPISGQARSECRVFERVACDRPTSCRPASLLAMKEQGWAATMRDISRGGVRLQVPRRFEKGTALAIELPASHDQDASTVFVRVVFIKSHEDGTWMLGCQFVSELSDDEVQRVVAPYVSAAAAPELPQVKILPNAQLRINLDGGSQISCAIKRFDASKCWPLTPGKIVRISGRGRDRENWALRLELLHCVEEANLWKLETRLLRSPCLTDLLQVLGS